MEVISHVTVHLRVQPSLAEKPGADPGCQAPAQPPALWGGIDLPQKPVKVTPGDGISGLPTHCSCK